MYLADCERMARHALGLTYEVVVVTKAFKDDGKASLR